MERNEDDMRPHGGDRGSRIWSGLFLIAAGVLLLAYKMGAGIPSWIFTWPVLLIAIGTLIGIKSRFHNPGAFIMIMVGSVFLIEQTNPELNFHTYIWPAVLIGVGLIYVLRPKKNWSGRSGRDWGGRSRRDWRRMYYDPSSPAGDQPAPPGAPSFNPDPKNSVQEDNAEFVEINTAFGSVKKIILSKNFKGGEINNFMGGTEINLMKADIQQPVSLEVNNVFGGAKLIVPSNWDVKNEVTAVFGGIEDKRTFFTGTADPGKIIILKGTCVFGGIEITNY